MAGNYPYKIVRTGDKVETVFGKFHTILYVMSEGKRGFDCVVDKLDGVVVDVDGRTTTIQREVIRKVHTMEKKKCPKKTKALTA